MSAFMQIARMLLLGLALIGTTAWAKDNDPCLQKPTVYDVQFTLSLNDSRKWINSNGERIYSGIDRKPRKRSKGTSNRIDGVTRNG
jgi:hypothetical protein